MVLSFPLTCFQGPISLWASVCSSAKWDLQYADDGFSPEFATKGRGYTQELGVKGRPCYSIDGLGGPCGGPEKMIGTGCQPHGLQ